MKTDLINKLTALINAMATAILMCEAKAGKIDAAVELVNVAFEANGEPKPLPAGEYKRRAWLVADLVRMRQDLIEELREMYTEDEARDAADFDNLTIDQQRRVALYPETVINSEVAHAKALAEDFTRLIDAQRAAGLPVDEEGNDLREWCGNDIEAAHAEALAMLDGGDDVPPPPAEIRIDQETSDKEFKKAGIFAKDNVHCFTTCGYNCKEAVRLALIEHYTKVAQDNGLIAEGWHLQVWHNTGWHAVLKHEASGFMLCDYGVSGGIDEMKHKPYIHAKRWACYNYDTPAGTAQIWVYAATPWQAIGGVIREAQASITGYRGIIGALAPAQCEHAKAANLYGEAAPAGSYEVHQ